MSQREIHADKNGLNQADVARLAVHEKLGDAMVPGYQAEFDPDEAEYAGAFVEDALSEQDALESSIDLNDAAEWEEE